MVISLIPSRYLSHVFIITGFRCSFLSNTRHIVNLFIVEELIRYKNFVNTQCAPYVIFMVGVGVEAGCIIINQVWLELDLFYILL